MFVVTREEFDRAIEIFNHPKDYESADFTWALDIRNKLVSNLSDAQKPIDDFTSHLPDYYRRLPLIPFVQNSIKGVMSHDRVPFVKIAEDLPEDTNE